MNELIDLEQKSVEGLIVNVRGERVILDSDLAGLFDTTTRQLNQQIKRNIARFDNQFAFQLTREEFADLKREGGRVSGRHGGRRTLPWAFTEHGVPMAATVLRTGRAVEALKLIIQVFVDVRRQMASGAAMVKNDVEERTRMQAMREKLVLMADAIIEFELNKRDKVTVQEEIEKITTSVLDNVKAQLNSKPLQNEALVAKIQKRITETEKLRAEIRRTEAETDSIDLKNMRERFEILRSIQVALDAETNEIWAAMGALGRPEQLPSLDGPDGNMSMSTTEPAGVDENMKNPRT